MVCAHAIETKPYATFVFSKVAKNIYYVPIVMILIKDKIILMISGS